MHAMQMKIHFSATHFGLRLFSPNKEMMEA